MSYLRDIALKEIHNTLKRCDWCLRRNGITIINIPKEYKTRIFLYFIYCLSILLLLLLIVGELCFIINLLDSSASIVEFVANLHIVGYGTMSLVKILTIRSKRQIFSNLVQELSEIWPVSHEYKTDSEIKKKCLSNLKIGQFLYFLLNVVGLWTYNLTPIVYFLYNLIRGEPTKLGLVWRVYYPFDVSSPWAHALAYLAEVYAGNTSAFAMLGSDLLFMSMACHLSLLMQLLQEKARRLAQEKEDIGGSTNVDCYEDILAVIKIHQRLIKYSDDLEKAFTFSNFVNVILSSANICFVVFSIAILDPWLAMSNKLFLLAALTQIGFLCLYADDIYRQSVGVAQAVYESGWYRTNPRCRRALLMILIRSQKPLCFTVMKFSPITMNTYRTILTTSYSYFALLYTMYVKHD